MRPSYLDDDIMTLEKKSYFCYHCREKVFLNKYQVISASTSFSGGIRCGELGGVMHGKDPQNLEEDNEFEDENGELLRLAIPRRTYTESHMK